MAEPALTATAQSVGATQNRPGLLWLSRPRSALVLALLLLLGLRFGYGFVRVGWPQLGWKVGGDAEDFLILAWTLKETGQFGRPPGLDVKALVLSGDPAPQALGEIEPDAWRLPAWPWLLSVFLRITGSDLRGVLALRFFLDAATLLAFYALVARRLPPQAASVAVLAFAMQPSWLMYSVTLLSEPLILLVHLLFTLALLRVSEEKGSLAVVAAGVLGGLIGLTHSFFVLYPALLLLVFWRAGRLPLRRAALVAVTATVVVLPWGIRNMLVYDAPFPILTTGMGTNLAKGWSSDFLSTYRNSADTLLDENFGIAPAELEGLDSYGRSALYTARAGSWIRREWPMVPALVARKLVGAVNPFPEKAKPGGLLETARTLWQLLTLLPLAWVVLRGGDRPLSLSARAMAVAYLLMCVICFGSLRYRFPLVWAEALALGLVLERRGEQGQVVG